MMMLYQILVVPVRSEISQIWLNRQVLNQLHSYT